MGRFYTLGWAVMLSLAVGGSLAIDIAGIAIPAIADPHYIVDFSVFLAAARIAPDLVYDPAALSQAQLWLTGPTGLRPFAYPPSFFILLKPFGWLPHWPALFSWNGLTMKWR